MPQFARAGLGELLSGLKRATAAIYIFTGPRYFQERALRALRNTFPGGADSGAVIGLDEGKFDPVELCDLARELPMFTPRRLLFALGLKDKDLKALAAPELHAGDLFDAPNAKVTLVLGCAEGKLVFSPYCVDTAPFHVTEADRQRMRETGRRLADGYLKDPPLLAHNAASQLASHDRFAAEKALEMSGGFTTNFPDAH